MVVAAESHELPVATMFDKQTIYELISKPNVQFVEWEMGSRNLERKYSKMQPSSNKGIEAVKFVCKLKLILLWLRKCSGLCSSLRKLANSRVVSR